MSADGRLLRILLVEDEKLNRELVRAILARAANPTLKNAHLVQAENLAQARALLADHTFDIVLLDVQLPDGSGLTIAEQLQGVPQPRRPAIIALTAGALPEQFAAARAAGCDTIVTKPHTAAELVATLVTFLPPAPDDR